MEILTDALPNPDWVRYGVEGAIFFVGMVILGAMVLWVRHSIKQLDNRMKAQDKRAEAQDATLANVSRNTEHRHTAEGEAVDSSTRREIRFNLTRLLKETSGARAYFVVYHNGVWINNGFRLPKMSIYSEVINGVSVEPITSQLQALPRSFLPVFDDANSLDNFAEPRVFQDIAEIKEEDPMTYSWLKSHNATGFIAQEVCDIERKYPIGFVMVEFDNQHHSELDEKDLKITVSKTTEAIASILHFTDSDDKIISGSLELGETKRGGKENAGK